LSRRLPLIQMATDFSVDALKVEHQEKRKRWIIKIGRDIAYLSYVENPPGVFDLEHTVVPQALQGRGIAKVLAKEAMDYVVKNDKKMILTCTYLQKYEKDNPNPDYKKRIYKP